MIPPEAHPPDRGTGADQSSVPPDGYQMHALTALDGVLLYVTQRGEHVGSYFGNTEHAAAAAFATDLIDTVTGDQNEAGE
jgi:hypothetical protein